MKCVLARLAARLAGSSEPVRRGSSTFHGSDPHTVAADSICKASPTRCQARTRLYRDGRLADQGFPVARISDHLVDGTPRSGSTCATPTARTSLVLQDEFGLHPLAIEDALLDRRAAEARPVRHAPVPERLRGAARHRPPASSRTSEIAAFITAAGADHRPQGRRPRHRQGRRALGRQRRPGQPRRRLPAVRTARLHRRRPLRGGAVARRRGRGAGGPPLRRHAARTCRCSAAPSSCASAWCCCAASCSDARSRELADAPRPARRRRAS